MTVRNSPCATGLAFGVPIATALWAVILAFCLGSVLSREEGCRLNASCAELGGTSEGGTCVLGRSK